MHSIRKTNYTKNISGHMLEVTYLHVCDTYYNKDLD